MINVNVPNVALGELAGWRAAEVGAVPPRIVDGASLEPKVGHDGSFYVRMSWGDAMVCDCTKPPRGAS